MKYAINIDTARHMGTITTEGDGTADEIIAFMKDLVENPDWKPNMKLLVDHSRLKIDQIQYDGIQLISDYHKRIDSMIGNGKLALVMNREVDFGIARSWEIVTASDVGADIKVFRDLDEANDWLNQSP